MSWQGEERQHVEGGLFLEGWGWVGARWVVLHVPLLQLSQTSIRTQGSWARMSDGPSDKHGFLAIYFAYPCFRALFARCSRSIIAVQCRYGTRVR